MNFSERLPESKLYSYLHYRTNAYQCKPLTITKSKNVTLKVKHLFLLKDLATRCLVLGIEIYVYLTIQGDLLTRHIFVLKADTTGLSSSKFSVAGVVLEFLKYLIDLNPESYYENASLWNTDKKEDHSNDTKNKASQLSANGSEYAVVNELRALSKKLSHNSNFLRSISYYLDQPKKNAAQQGTTFSRSTKMITKVSLFTRSANAYLFPESEKNPKKHVASGDRLFSWWISLLSKTIDSSWCCKADIPGSDARSIERFLPNQDNWSRGNIYVSEYNCHAIGSIPLFPDDPKGRFLEHLVLENRYKGMNTTRYWNELGFRQEFRLGNVVGIIGCSSPCCSTAGVEEDLSTVVATRKQYKKLHKLVKGEDYAKEDYVRDLCEDGIAQLLKRIGLREKEIIVVGSKKRVPKTINSPEVKPAGGVTDLNSLVKKRKKQ